MTPKLLRHLALSILLTVACSEAQGQKSVISDPNIRTLQLSVNGKQLPVPVIRLNSDDRLEVSFDELSHTYKRFTYKVEHVSALFEQTESLFENDYLSSVPDEVVIEDYDQSMNTSVLYTHYRFSLPNVQVRPTLSGNYRLTVYGENDEGDPQTALVTYFYVSEEAAGSMASATTNTDIDWNDAHQQLSLEVNFSQLKNVRAPYDEIKVIALQNGQWDKAAIFPQPTGQTGQSLVWQHSRELIFPAGNEYRKFEINSTRSPGLHIDNIKYFDPYYHVTLQTDKPRTNYLYDEDQNGIFVPLSNTGESSDTEADYVWVHFTLDTPQLPGETVYVDGAWTYGQSAPPYALTYRPKAQAYEGAILLKQGYYSYQYLQKKDNAVQAVEGNFWQTKNEYTILIYYCQTGSRYDRLVGWRTTSYRPQ